MVKHIIVSEDTHKKLNMLKIETGAKSVDVVITNILVGLGETND